MRRNEGRSESVSLELQQKNIFAEKRMDKIALIDRSIIENATQKIHFTEWKEVLVRFGSRAQVEKCV